MEVVDEKPSPAVGIDLGTTYSCVAVWQNGRVEIVPNDQGNNTTPVCVAFADSERHFAQVAKNQADINPSNTIFDVKRLLGRSFDDEALLDNMKLLPFKIIGEEIKPKIVVKYKGVERSFAPEEISAMFLCQMAEFAEDYLGTIVKDVVVTVPACFNNIQRQATKDAGRIAGLNVVSIINEPTAAAIAYGLDRVTNDRKNVLVFHLGGGTFDASLVIIENARFEVKSVSGNTHLGGRDFDNRMIEHLATLYQRKHGKNIRENSRTIEKLRAACERAKIILSSETSTSIEIDCFFEGRAVYSTITRAQFERLNMDLFVECIYHTAKCLKDAKMDRNDINEIVLVGGSSRIPMVQQLVQDFFCGKELCNSINPDEAVAYGAAAKAAVLSGRDHMSFSVVDVTPYSLGLNSNHDATHMSVVIPRNTPIPTRMLKTLSDIPYAQDNPHLLAFQVFEGERPKVKDNISLGVFTLHGIPPAPECIPKRNICFQIDADGILTCSFYDLETGYTNEFSIEHPSGHLQLSREEVVKMMKVAESFKRADEWRRQSAKARIALEKYAKTMSDMLKDHRKKIGRKDNHKMVVAIEHTREYIVYHWNYLQSKAQKFEEQMKEFKKICDPIVAKMLKNDGGKASGAAGA